MTKAYYTPLPNRAAVTVSGPDARDFLQGLITQDVHILEGQKLAYGAILTPQGKFFADFMFFAEGNGVTLDCDASRADAIAQKLSMYKLRRAVSITAAPLRVTAFWGAEADDQPYPADPRNKALGWRVYAADPASLEGIAERADYEAYDSLRLSLGVPEGVRDFAAGEDNVAEMGLEHLHGVSFSKGCYMGQELTSRMHHRSLGKKGLYPVRIDGAALPPFTDIVADGNLIGEMRSSNGGFGLAMLRHDSLPLAHKAGLRTAPEN